MEVGVRSHVHRQQQVAGWSAPGAGLALSGQPNGAPVLHAVRNLHGDAFGLFPAANLQAVAAPFGGDLKGDGDIERDVLTLATARLVPERRLAGTRMAAAKTAGKGQAFELRAASAAAKGLSAAEELPKQVAQVDG